MKIAIPIANGKLCMHFGHCQQFALVETQDNSITNTSLVTPPPHEPGILPKWLAEQNVKLVIAGGMGMRAQNIFESHNIKVIVGAGCDTPEKIVQDYLAGKLTTGQNICSH